jgi:sulfite exporter TauE/SafE
VDGALIASATLLGLAGAPHCAVMCSAPCAAAIGGGGARASLAFHGARVASYGVGGAVAASSVAALASWAAWSPAIRPVWTLAQVLAMALGLWLLWQGRQPVWMAALGRAPRSGSINGWQGIRAPVRAAATGGMWVGWPCGLLQSALLVAAMTADAMTGALAMAGFAVASSMGLIFAPWAWRHLLSGHPSRERWATRAAGLLLAGAAAWALGHGMWQQVADYCSSR